MNYCTKPPRNRLLIGLVSLGGLVHARNHACDALVHQATLMKWAADGGPVALAAGLLIIMQKSSSADI